MLPLKIQRFLPDRQEPITILVLPVPHVMAHIFNFVPHVIYSLWICTFAITKFINKILRNQMQYRYISTQIVMLSLSDIDATIDGDCQLKLACLVSDTVRLIFIIILQVRESASSQRSQE